MLRNYIKIAFRTLWKSKGYAAINIVGLSVAFCICVFLFLTTYRQLTFDSFHADADRIFQPYFFSNDPERVTRSGGLPLPLTPTLKAEYPEVEAAARIMTGATSLIAYQGKYFDKLVTLTDPDFLNLFSFPLIKGNRQNALQDLSSIVISESMARTIFGSEDPMGRQLQVGGDDNPRNYIVTGVLADLPDNSSIRGDALIRIENAANYQADKDKWDANTHTAFIKLSPNADQQTVEDRLKLFSLKYFPSSIETLKKKGAQPDERGDLFAIRLQKLADVHFNTDISGGKGAPIAVVYALSGLGLFILLIACINFINLSVARSFSRAREVGVRKSLGALKSQLFVQIWGESILICFMGFMIGSLLAYKLVPEFNAFFEARIDLAYLLQPGFIAVMLGVFAVVTLVAGGFPAWKMATFNPVEVLKGKVTLKRPGVLRSSLIITQFTISSLLICCTIIAVQQIGYLRQRPLGFQKEQVISIPIGNRVNGRQVLDRIRNRLANDPTVLSVTGSGVNLGRGKDRVTSRTVLGFTYKDKEVSTDWLLVDYDYLKTLNIKLLAGREFDRAYATDSVNRVIITESMARAIGLKNPVGSYFDTDTAGTRYQVIGLIPDFHLYSVTDELKPITMHLSHSEPINYVFVRVVPQSLTGAMEKLTHLWQEVAPQSEFMGSFLDENIDAWYKNEQMLSQIFSLASGVAILLSCLGLFAVALLVIEQRTKEIGVRKVMGASIANIVLMLSRDFVRLVFIALAIAIPLAWFGMQKWLDHYPYRIDINAWVFVLVGLSAILIALATVSYQTIKAALANPVKSLRSE
ncbi:FtsX-like permease family protein [Spirosoma taeanense]|uniref:FtsX-like permease family protein n=2 Tax=Spirosoma taeanense TaxID=2735870 RepID=A0A6M5YGD8_9BACT|nr:FtsX-like permease family protein [Spirosoma taeanense]